MAWFAVRHSPHPHQPTSHLVFFAMHYALCSMPLLPATCNAQLATRNPLSSTSSSVEQCLTLCAMPFAPCSLPYALRLEPYTLLQSSIHDLQSQIPYPISQIERPVYPIFSTIAAPVSPAAHPPNSRYPPPAITTSSIPSMIRRPAVGPWGCPNIKEQP